MDWPMRADASSEAASASRPASRSTTSGNARPIRHTAHNSPDRESPVNSAPHSVHRDDSANFLGIYEQQGILKQDPFISLDVEGVGELVRIGAERGRAQRPGLKLGICGEHGGDPASIRFCQSVGLDYVSCSPYRVPIARLAAAQAAMAEKR